RAEAALQAVMLPEGLLQRMQLFALRRLPGEAFHRAQRLALSLHGEHEAGAHRLALDEHGACAAHAVLAAQVRSGEPAVLAQRIREAAPGLDLDVEGDAVDVQGNGNPVAHGRASRSARSVVARTRCLR